MWTSGAEEALKKKHKLRKYTPNDFRDYSDFVAALAEKRAVLERITPHCDVDQIRMLRKCFDSIENSTDRWQTGKIFTLK